MYYVYNANAMETYMRIIQTRVDDELRQNVEEIFGNMGITVNDGIRLFLYQVRNERGLPFRPSADEWLPHRTSSHVPNAETEKAIQDMETDIETETFDKAEDLFSSLGM
jgi:addiction module RelB/DinJ family antitoxin